MTAVSPRVANKAVRAGAFAFRPIDAGARDGKFYLLRDVRGHHHSGRWEPGSGGKAGAWVYAAGKPIAREITHYAARVPSGNALEEID